MQSKEGSRQGDGPSGLFFCAGMMPMLREAKRLFPECRFYAYMDDVTIVGPEGETKRAYEFCCAKLAAIGLQVNNTKSEVYPPWRQPMTDGPSPKENGIKVLGAYISFSDDATKEFLMTRVEKHETFFDRITELAGEHPREALALLKVCGVPKINHLMRTHSPTLTKEMCDKFDALVNDCLHTIRGEPWSDPDRDLADLPQRMGGLGVAKTLDQREDAYSASISALGWSDSPTQRTATTLRYTTKVDEHALNPHVSATLCSNSRKFAACWLTAFRTTMSAAATRTAMKLRVASTAWTPGTCGCGKALDGRDFVTHVLGCAQNTGFNVSSRHNQLRDTLAQIARRCAIPVTIEPREFISADGRHPDLTLFWPDGTTTTIDVHINNATAPSHIGEHDPTRKSKKAKILKYTDQVTAAEQLFRTAGWEVSGACSKEALSLLKELAAMNVMSLHEIAEALCVCIHAANHRIIAAAYARDRAMDI